MKRNRSSIPQFEFSFSADTFNLFAESTLDGTTLSQLREKQEQDKAEAEKRQEPLPGTQPEPLP